MLTKLKVSILLATFSGLLPSQAVMGAVDNWRLNMHKGVTPLSKDIYDLHMIAIAVCALIGIVVFSIMIYSIVHHRQSKGHAAALFHDNFRLEIVWSIVPFLILIGLAIPATKVLIRQEDSAQSEVTIKIVGYQWKWQYQYLNQGISYFSSLSTPYAQIENKQKKGPWYLLEVDKPLVVPIHKKIRFLVTANDVIHSWWVPALGVKRDAIPGFMHEAWANIEKPGIYRGQCTELCGINHAYMPIVVHAVEEKDFNAWVAQQNKVADNYATNDFNPALQEEKSRTDLMTEGKLNYEKACLVCHKADGKGMPPLFPALKGSSVAVGKPISRHILLILNGVPGTAMQSFKEQLTDAEIASIVTYERNAWENNTNDVVQPADVAKLRHTALPPPKIVKKAQAGDLK